MLSKTVIIALALAIATASNAFAATKKSTRVQNHMAMSTTVGSAFASAAGPSWLYDRAKGNINGF
jgi:hypothetical protein